MHLQDKANRGINTHRIFPNAWSATCIIESTGSAFQLMEDADVLLSMLDLPTTLLFAGTLIFLLLPVLMAWRLVGQIVFRPSDPALPEDQLPPVAVVLPLRGADPSLSDCLRGLLQQDYPRYTLRIVIDSLEDPAWEVVPEILASGHGSNVEVRVATVRERCSTCTLKISAQMQAVAELEPEYTIIAMADADAVPPRQWLRWLVAPFADPTVGGVSGFRWYAPRAPSLGALVRHMWNAACQTQMMHFGHPWGGTSAVRAALFREENGLLAQWKRSFCDDSGAGNHLRKRGLKLRHLPALTMVNCETIDLPGACRFIRRQLLCPRLDMAHWPLWLGYNIGTLAAVAIAVAMVLAGWAEGNLTWVAWFGGALAGYIVGLGGALQSAEIFIRRMVRARGQTVPPLTFSWQMVVAPFLTQVLFYGCLAAAVLARTITWRGVAYTIEGPGRVRLVNYQPFQQARGQKDRERSIS